MLRSHWIFFGLAVGTTVGLAGACGSNGTNPGAGGQGGTSSSTTTTSSSSSSGATSSSSSGSSSSSAAASSSSGLVCNTTMGTVLAVSQLAFGDGMNGQWKSLGFDIDGQNWMPGATNHCQPNAGADPNKYFPNGVNGIDNSFGDNLLPIIIQVDPSLVSDTNMGLTDGVFTAMLKMYCLPPTGDVSGMTTKLFGGTNLGGDAGIVQPKWDGTDMWPVSPDLLTTPTDPESSSIVFPMSSVTGSTFDTGKNQTFVLTIPLNANNVSTSMKLTLHAAEATTTLAADRKSATNGVLGGVLNTEDFIAEVQKIGSLLGVCSQGFWPSVITTIRQSSDIMDDGTQDPTKTCNGISVGLGFQMKQVQLGSVGPGTVTGSSCVCTDAGTCM